MSVEAIGIVLNHSRATGTAKLVLIGIANHEGDGGSWPTIATLARYAGVTARNVQKAIGQLVDLGEVSVQLGAGGGRETPDHMRSNRYRILVKCPRDCDRTSNHRTGSQPNPDPLSPATPPVASDTPSPPVASDGGPPVASDTSPVSPATPEPSLEPSTPQPPSRACARHATPTANCRGCGTTQRQTEAQILQEAEAARRAANDRAIQADRAAIARAASAEQRAAHAREARRLIAAARGQR